MAIFFNWQDRSDVAFESEELSFFIVNPWQKDHCNKTVTIRLDSRLKRLNDDPKSRWGPCGGRFLGSLFTIPDFQTKFEVGVEFIPTIRATHKHSTNIWRDTKRLMTSFAFFDNVIFHRYSIGRRVATIKQRFIIKNLKFIFGIQCLPDRDSPGIFSNLKIKPGKKGVHACKFSRFALVSLIIWRFYSHHP